MLTSSTGCNDGDLRIPVENTVISSSGKIKVLGVTIDNKLKFNQHICDVCIKAGKQLNVFQRLKHSLANQVYKCVYNLNPSYHNEMFIKKYRSYDLRGASILERPVAITTGYGLKSV